MSLEAELIKRIGCVPITALFQPAMAWLDHLFGVSFKVDGKVFIPGEYIDFIWRNAFPVGDKLEFIDKEWVWLEPIELNCLILRSINLFLEKLEAHDIEIPELAQKNKYWQIRTIANFLGHRFTYKDILSYIRHESQFQAEVANVSMGTHYFKSLLEFRFPKFFRFASIFKKFFAGFVKSLGILFLGMPDCIIDLVSVTL